MEKFYKNASVDRQLKT